MSARLTALSILWLVSYVCAVVFRVDLLALFASPNVLLEGLLLAFGLILLALAIRSLARSRGGLVSILVLIGGFAGVTTSTQYLSIDVRFGLALKSYERKIAPALRGEGSKFSDFAGVEGDAPTQRVAFYWTRGVTDNWSAIVYDPTDSLAEASLRSGQRSYFGGDLATSRHLRGHWYLCGFT